MAGRTRKPKAVDSLGRKLTEKKIQAAILRWLKKQPYLYWRQNAGMLKAGTRRVRLGPKGISDIIVIIPPNGRFVGLEVKKPRSYQNPDQKLFQANVEAMGGVYQVVRSVEEVKECLLQLGCTIIMSAREKKLGRTGLRSDPWKL